jgi:hypothetical protein
MAICFSLFFFSEYLRPVLQETGTKFTICSCVTWIELSDTQLIENSSVHVITTHMSTVALIVVLFIIVIKRTI